MEKTHSNKVAIVTGSTKGIGFGIAQALSISGANIIITSRTKSHAEETAANINAYGGNAVGINFDITKQEDLDHLVTETIKEFGQLDILVNNAVSQNCLIPSADFSDDKSITTITENLTHTYLLSQKAYPHLKKQKGSILNISSVITQRYLMGLPLYGIIKGALTQMTKVLAAEWACEGVRVNAINPGFIRTSAFKDMGLSDDLIKKSYHFYSQYQQLGGIGEPSKIGSAAAFLTSSEASFITGSILDVDGGYSTRGQELYQPA